MSIRTQLSSLVGEWAGTNRVWLMPGEPVRESATAVLQVDPKSDSDRH